MLPNEWHFPSINGYFSLLPAATLTNLTDLFSKIDAKQSLVYIEQPIIKQFKRKQEAFNYEENSRVSNMRERSPAHEFAYESS